MGEPAGEEAATEEAAVEAAPAKEEEDGPLEDWTKKELAEEYKTLGLSDKGTKAVLISRIKEARESAVEEAPAEETPAEEAAVEEAPVEEAVGEEAPLEE